MKKHPALKVRVGGWGDDRKVSRLLLRKVGFEVEAQAKKNAPVDTGRLRGSIATSWAGSPGRPTSHKKYKADPRDSLPPPRRRHAVWVGTNVAYGGAVHERHPSARKYLSRAARTVRKRVARLAKGFDSRGR